MTSTLTEADVLNALRQVVDPEIGCNIVDLGLIYSVTINEGAVHVAMTLTSPGCPMQDSIAAGAQVAVLNLEPVTDATVELVWTPAWHPSMITERGQSFLNRKPN